MTETSSRGFSVQGAVSPYFGPTGHVSGLGPLGTRPRVGARPQHPCGRPPHVIYPLAAAKNRLGFVYVELAIATASQRACWINRPSDC